MPDLPILVVGGGIGGLAAALTLARVQVTARYYGDIYHAAGVVREVRNGFLRPDAPPDPGAKPTFSGVAWLYDGIQVQTAPPGG